MTTTGSVRNGSTISPAEWARHAEAMRKQGYVLRNESSDGGRCYVEENPPEGEIPLEFCYNGNGEIR